VREFASHGRIQALPAPAKVLYTVFAVFTVAGLINSLMLYDVMVDFGAKTTPAELNERLVGHYQGEPVDTGSHAISMARPLDRATLLEVSHAHLFTMPVLLLIVGHLLLLTGLSKAGKHWLIGLATAGTTLHLLAPWLVRSFGRAVGWFYPMSGALLFIPMVLMLGISVVAMWMPREPSRNAPEP
jgi:hypothetical protein